MLYKCVRSFQDSKGRTHRRGQHITSSDYAKLSYSDQVNFRSEDQDDIDEEEDDQDEPSILGPALDIASAAIDLLTMLPDTDNGSSSSGGDVFGGFDGGDSGGGGASGDW